MKYNTRARTYCNRPVRRYPNEADPGYFLGKIREGLLAAVSTTATVSFFLILLAAL